MAPTPPKERIVYRFGRFELDRSARVLFHGSDPVAMAPRTVETLIVLLEGEGRVLTKDELLSRIWPDRAVEEVNLTQQISLLRRALAARADGVEYVRNFPGRGYQFAIPVERVAPAPTAPGAAAEAAPPIRAPRSRPAPMWVWLGVAGLAVFGIVLWRWSRDAAAPAVAGAPVAPRRAPLSRLPGSKSHPALSPDGTRVAFVWNRGGETGEPCLFVKGEGTEEPQPVANSCGNPGSPAWSPDGSKLAYLQHRPASTELLLHSEFGADRVLASFVPLRSLIGNRLMDWSPDGKWIAVGGKTSFESPLSIMLVSAETGERRPLTTPPVSAIGDTDPAFSPDGRQLAFVRMPSRFTQSLYVTAVGGGPQRQIVGGDQQVGGVVWNESGNELLFSANRSGGFRLWRAVADREGATPVPDSSGIAGENPIHLSIAWRARRLAYVVTGEDLNIWRLRLGEKPEWTRLIASTGLDAAPQYSPDGSRICFLSDRSGEEHIWVAKSDGSQPRQLSSGSLYPGHCAWTADGEKVLFVGHGAGYGGVYTVAASGQEKPRSLAMDGGGGSLPVASPDGRSIYLVRATGERYELYVAGTDDGQMRQLTRRGAHRAKLAPDGKTVYYMKGRISPELWRVTAAGDGESRVLTGVIPGYFGSWAVSETGVYYLGEDARSQRPFLYFFDFANRRNSAVTAMPTPLPPLGLAEFSISPDRRDLLMVRRESSSSDLVALYDFR